MTAQETLYTKHRRLFNDTHTGHRFLAKMSCTDDLTAEDLTTNVTTEVLERVTAGEGSNTNLWPNINVAWYVLASEAMLCLLRRVRGWSQCMQHSAG